jgi:hypothetical protein
MLCATFEYWLPISVVLGLFQYLGYLEKYLRLQ